MGDTLPKIRMVALEVRVGGRYGATPRTGRRGLLLFSCQVPETVLDYLRDDALFTAAPVPDTVGAVAVYFGDEVLRSWTARDHEVSLARVAEVSDLDASIAERKVTLQGLEQTLQLLQRAVGLAEGQVAQLTAARKEEATALAADRARGEGERARVVADIDAVRAELERVRGRAEAELANLGQWVQANRARALEETTAYASAWDTMRGQLSASIEQMGGIAAQVIEREGTVATQAGTRQVEVQSQALANVQLLGEMVQQVRSGSHAALSVPTGPTPVDKLIDLGKDVLNGPLGKAAGGLIEAYARRVNGDPATD